MTKAMVFDLDGTLVDTIDDIMNSANRALAEFGFPPHTREQYIHYVGSGVKALITRMLADYPHTQEQWQQVFDFYAGYYKQHSLELSKPYDGIREVLDACKAKGIACAVVSNKPMVQTQIVIDALFEPDDFAVVYGHKDPYLPKPDPTAVLDILGQMGVTPADCVYIGDTDVDMFTAKNAELYAVGAVWGFRDREELEHTGADICLEKPIELLQLI